ncbi:hypothetical protein Hypma_013697 [Hypsizygus marmoreus]|uniref:F-box domain-containing protein n=1 Tax=Hypsizygus marmoreus TaxID=39966 RepID=A0A369JKG6_HYPMA|nr:hypothetical protein Hypma_013697 [Hypsizygus marmoreus]
MSTPRIDHSLSVDEGIRREAEVFAKPTQTLHLLDFPDELLLLILTHVPPRSLYTLATLCTKLHYIALPVYFHLQGLSLPDSDGTLTLTPSNLNALPGLRIALFSTQQPIRHISCVFSHQDDAFLASVRRLSAVLTRLGDIEDVVLNFSLIEEVESHPLTWCEPLENLLETVIASGCRKLKVRGDLLCLEWLHSLSPPSSPPPSPLAARRVNVKQLGGLGTRIAKKLASVGRKRRPRPILVEFPPTETLPEVVRPKSSTTSNLRELTVTSSMLVHGLLPDWTLRALNTSTRLTTLSLLNLPFPGRATHAFTHIHIPALAHLTIKSCPIDFPTLSLLLTRHAGTLTSLTIDKLLEHASSSSSPHASREVGWTPIRSDITLPFITHLAAPARYIPQFLTWRCVLPSLAALTVLAGTPRTLILFEFALVPWHLLDYVADRVDTCELALDVVLSGEEDGALCTADPTGARGMYVRRVRKLVVRFCRGEGLERRLWEKLRMWLDCFEDVEEVVFVLDGEEELGRWESGDEKSGSPERGKGGLTLRDEKVRRAFVHELMPFFSRVPRVRIGDHDLW